jgi:arylsulfatase A-like enzyme
MLGYGAVAPWYPVEMPTTVARSGYITQSIGKDHFGWNSTSNHGIAHGYGVTQLYDGLGSWDPKAPTNWDGEFDDYDKWFQTVMPGKDPEATLDAQGAAHGGANDGWNGWHGAAYVYDEQYHPTAWVGRQAVSFIQAANKTATPFLLKVSFHRPHSPYDPPARVMDKFKVSELPPIVAGTGWDLRFRGQPGDPTGCGQQDPDAWCGLMQTNMTNVSRVACEWLVSLCRPNSFVGSLPCGHRLIAPHLPPSHPSHAWQTPSTPPDYGSVAFVDEQVGHIYKALVESDLLEKSYIIWTSDHGDGQGDHYHVRPLCASP